MAKLFALSLGQSDVAIQRRAAASRHRLVHRLDEIFGRSR